MAQSLEFLERSQIGVSRHSSIRQHGLVWRQLEQSDFRQCGSDYLHCLVGITECQAIRFKSFCALVPLCHGIGFSALDGESQSNALGVRIDLHAGYSRRCFCMLQHGSQSYGRRRSPLALAYAGAGGCYACYIQLGRRPCHVARSHSFGTRPAAPKNCRINSLRMQRGRRDCLFYAYPCRGWRVSSMGSCERDSKQRHAFQFAFLLPGSWKGGGCRLCPLSGSLQSTGCARQYASSSGTSVLPESNTCYRNFSKDSGPVVAGVIWWACMLLVAYEGSSVLVAAYPWNRLILYR